MARMLSAVSLVAVIATGLTAQDLVQLDVSTIRPGQALVVELTDNVLKDYARCCNIPDDVEKISFCVFVHFVLDDGRFVVEYSKQVDLNGKPDRLVTFALSVDRTALQRYHAPGARLAR